MSLLTVPVRLARRAERYDIRIGDGLLKGCGEWTAACTGTVGRAGLISNPTVYGLYGETAHASLKKAKFDVHVHLIGDGERHKNLRTLEETLKSLGEKRFSRTDCVIALGGGVVGDLAGFAASVYLRGIKFLQVPTTLLSMIDSSVGGKTGINSSFGKNLIGSFYQPAGVLIDIETLRTLPDRELTAGFCEAIKQGALSGRRLLDQTSGFLADHRDFTSNKENAYLRLLAQLIAAQVAFKAKIVRGDERESTSKTDAAARKILNFGHTLAHSLEKVTNYRRFRHGEAVGHGIRFAAALSKKLGLLEANEVELLNDVVHRAGPLPSLRGVDAAKVFEAFRYDKKVAGGSLQWILLKSIGKPVIFPNQDIPPSFLSETFNEINK